MERSNPEGEPNSTVINASEGNDELNDDGVVNQEGSLVDEITDVMMTRNDELDLRHELPDHSGLGEEEIPAIGMRFDSLHLAHEFYASYAKKLGFVTKVRNTNFDKMRKDTKIPINQSLHCTREGYRESRVKAATRSNRITATRCKARMYVMLDRENECWVVSRVELRHSHPCSADKAVHYHEYPELTMHAKCVITDNDEAGIRPNKTYLALANEVGGSSNLSFSEKDVRNYITSNLRCSDDNADFNEMMNYFLRMKEINPNFFYAIDVDDANKFRSALWVDARCRASYEYYGDVVSFDTTYRRNRHGLPFASFVGVNHHGKSTLLGCALLGNEEIPSFEWVFTQWVRCIGTAPKGIITDQCKAMAGAIRKVLPDTVHRWCIWHIMKKTQFKLSGYARYGELSAMMNHIVYNSPSSESFEVDWAAFIKEFALGQNRWLADLYANRRKWVPIFFKSEFWAGMRSTQRSESMHAFYGGYLHCKSGLVQFVHEYDNVLGNKEQKELEDDAADSKGVIPCIGSTGIERQFQQEYTSNMFRNLQLEVRKKTDCVVRSTEQKGDTISIKVDEQKVFWGKPVYHTFIIQFDPLSRKSRCECNKFESVGILCCHILAIWSYYRVDTVSSCYVLPRWSKNVIRKHTYIKSSHDVARSNESHNLFRNLCSEFYNVAQEFVACEEEAAILRAVLLDAKSKLTDHRTLKVKTKGRPKGKRLGAELDKSIKKSMEKRKRKSQPDVVDLQTDNDCQGSVDNRFEDSTIWNSADGGGFMDLLNSFRHL
ncbi:protein FAR1-RELATED SEQUENCE 5-like [Arachis duranensis]|uniref:Protein FAR1-RELATED SEQUENCE 5-like n=1 Tax=Arachis duranensis TaxID=130453 RepID=A0A6P4CED3_ARADU|nr:protein FAR1-RELATED SEQUENCE 5-like [Arachis duranensis]